MLGEYISFKCFHFLLKYIYMTSPSIQVTSAEVRSAKLEYGISLKWGYGMLDSAFPCVFSLMGPKGEPTTILLHQLGVLWILNIHGYTHPKVSAALSFGKNYGMLQIFMCWNQSLILPFKTYPMTSKQCILIPTPSHLKRLECSCLQRLC